jgi:membrane protein YdbS with pleckstrin-like domain
MFLKRWFVLVLVAAATISSLLSWMAFHPESSDSISGNPVIVAFILILGIAPIYPLYLQLRKRSALDAVFILLVIAVLISALVYMIAAWIFHLDSPWVSVVSELNTALLLAACALGIWNGLVKRKSITDN